MPIGQLVDAVFGGSQRAKDKENQRKNARRAYKFAKEQWRDNRARLRADRKFLDKKIKIDQRNAETLADYQTQTAQRRFNDQMAIRDVQIKQQNARYQKSVDLFNQQTQFNNEARDLAIGNANRQYQDDLQSIAFERRGLANDFQSFLDDQKNTLASAEIEYSGTRDQTNLGRVRNASTFADVQRQAQLGAADFQREFNLERANAAFENQNAIIEALQQQGSVEARGVTGKTAGRLANNALAGLGRNQARIKNQLLVGNANLNSQLDNLQRTLDTAARTRDIENVNLGQQLQNAQRRFDLSKTVSKDAVKNEQATYDLNNEILALNEKNAASDLQSAVADIMNRAKGAEIQALANLQLEPVDPPIPAEPLPVPVPDFVRPRKLKDYDFGPEPILQSVGDVNGFAPVVQGLDSAAQIAMMVAGAMSGAPGGLNFGSNQGIGLQPFDFGQLGQQAFPTNAPFSFGTSGTPNFGGFTQGFNIGNFFPTNQ